MGTQRLPPAQQEGMGWSLDLHHLYRVRLGMYRVRLGMHRGVVASQGECERLHIFSSDRGRCLQGAWVSLYSASTLVLSNQVCDQTASQVCSSRPKDSSSSTLPGVLIRGWARPRGQASGAMPVGACLHPLNVCSLGTWESLAYGNVLL